MKKKDIYNRIDRGEGIDKENEDKENNPANPNANIKLDQSDDAMKRFLKKRDPPKITKIKSTNTSDEELK